MAASTPAETPRPASLIVANPSGNRTRVALDPIPFGIGRHADNQLALRDNRASRSHARIIVENGDYVIEDLQSRHGTFVNGARVARKVLRNSDRVEFGFPDSYKLTFTLEEAEIHRILDQLSSSNHEPAAPSNLTKLRSLVEVARALQNSLSTQDVLAAVVDAALAVTGSERGFLLLRTKKELEVSVARDNRGQSLADSDLQVPRSVINRALHQRRELLSMQFDPMQQAVSPESSVANLELRSVVCVPLVRIKTGHGVEDTHSLSSAHDTIGLLYLDSRRSAADLSAGNRELLQTLALEASTILENARLLEEERLRQRMDEELKIARQIQSDLMPSKLPVSGWFRAAGSSIPSAQVGGDYFDVRRVAPDAWGTAIADVSGKGVSSALIASWLQGVFLLASDDRAHIEDMMGRINRFLYDRTKGEKYATVFFCALHSSGRMLWANAGHCAPLLLHSDGQIKGLQPTGMPLGMLESAVSQVVEMQLLPGDKLIAYTDGLTEAQNAEGAFFDTQRLRKIVRGCAEGSCEEIHTALHDAVQTFSGGTILSDDITIVVIEYRP